MISREESLYIKGLALILMFSHHLFAFPDRIISPSEYIPLFGNINVEYYFGKFGKICVPLFLFMSGYGFAVQGERHCLYHLVKVLRFFQVYWFYFLIFVPIGFVLYPDVTFINSDTIRFNPDFLSVVSNFFGISNSYNGEWWFLQPYVVCIVLVLALNKLSYKPFFLLILSFFIFITVSIADSYCLIELPQFVLNLLYWQLPFVMGYTYCHFNLGTIYNLNTSPKRLAISLFCLFVCSVLSIGFQWRGLIFSTPFLIIVMLILRKTIIALSFPFEVIGFYSMPMWLIHSFFCYYYWQEFIFWPKYSILVLVNLTISVFVVSYVLERIRIILVTHSVSVRTVSDSL